MSTSSPPDGDHGIDGQGRPVTFTYKPVRRIGQACGNCRRKKARCSGHRPKCHSCQRLQQECLYGDEDSPLRQGHQSAIHQPQHLNGGSAGSGQGSDLVLNKLHDLETRISDMSDVLNSVLGLLQHQSSLASPKMSTGDLSMDISPGKPVWASDDLPEGSSATHEGRIIQMAWPADGRPTNIPRAANHIIDNPLVFRGLVPFEVLSDVVNLYFSYSHNQPYSFFHEGNFRQRLTDGLLPDYLTFAILANAARFSTHTFFHGNPSSFAETYANRSWHAIVSNVFTRAEAPDFCTVQAITLLAIFDFTAGRGRHASAWIKIGLSVRIAQDLRLMMNPERDVPFAQQEEQRRTFWSIYILDRLASCGRARPPAILEACCELQLPCDERVWRAKNWEETQTLEGFMSRRLSADMQPGSFALVVLTSYVLCRCAQYTLQEYNIRSRDPPWDPNSGFASILSDLIYLESQFELGRPALEVIQQEYLEDGQIDQPRAGPLIFTHAIFYLSHCLLNHPFLLRRRLEVSGAKASSMFLSRAFESARDYAGRLTRLLRDAPQIGCIVLTSFYGYCAVVAGTIHGLHLHDTQEIVQLESAQYMQADLAFLESLSRYWKNGITMRNAFHAFSQDITSYRLLATPTPQIPSLEPLDSQMLWNLVDYSTVSNLADVPSADNPQQPSQFETDDGQWFDLFNSMGSVDHSNNLGHMT